MRMSIPLGKAVAMLTVVMCVGSSGRRLSHCCIDVRGSCAAYCWCSCVRRCFIAVCASGFVSAHMYVRMWCHVRSRPSSPAAVPPYISRTVMGCCGILYKARCWGVGLGGDCIGKGGLLVGHTRIGLLGVMSVRGGCWSCSWVLLLDGRSLGRGR